MSQAPPWRVKLEAFFVLWAFLGLPVILVFTVGIAFLGVRRAPRAAPGRGPR